MFPDIAGAKGTFRDYVHILNIYEHRGGRNGMGILIEGGIPLDGEADIQGSKNAALPILAGTLLAKGTTVLEHCPQISDVYHMTELMEELGCRTWWERDTLCVDAGQLESCEITKESAAKMRSSITFLGSLVGRCGEAQIPYPGGCVIGKRPIDLHIHGMQQLGVEFELTQAGIHARTHKLHGARIELAYPSVGATQNLMLAAVLADGITCIHGCAKEPEVVELGEFLNSMGAHVTWGTGQELVIDGVRELHPVRYEIPKDRIVAGTYMLAAAATRGNVMLHGAPLHQLGSLNDVLHKMGAVVKICGDAVAVHAHSASGSAGLVITGPYPAFPTDLQPQLAAALVGADSRSRIRETVFESRFAMLRELQKMNAAVSLENGIINIEGNSVMEGRTVHAADLRGGAALVIAGLMAHGTTRIEGCEYLERGYVDIAGDIHALGGNIRRV